MLQGTWDLRSHIWSLHTLVKKAKLETILDANRVQNLKVCQTHIGRKAICTEDLKIQNKIDIIPAAAVGGTQQGHAFAHKVEALANVQEQVNMSVRTPKLQRIRSVTRCVVNGRIHQRATVKPERTQPRHPRSFYVQT